MSAFLVNSTVTKKQFFSVKLLVRITGPVTYNTINLLYSEEELFWTKTQLLNFKVTLPMAKLVMVGSRLVSNGLIFSDDIPVTIQLVTFLLLSNISELRIGAKTIKNPDNRHHL